MVYVTTPNTPTSRSQKPEENQKVVIENPETGKSNVRKLTPRLSHNTTTHPVDHRNETDCDASGSFIHAKKP